LLELKFNDPPYASIVRAVRLREGWEGVIDDPNGASLLAGPVVLDVYGALTLAGDADQIIQQLWIGADLAADKLHGLSRVDRDELRSAWWRSAHKFVVDHALTVDRGVEIAELAKSLGVDQP
jgi:hypothetical protein